MNFPNGFKEKYQHLLGEDAAAFFATFEQEAVSAFRTNPLKETPKAFDDPIPKTPWGHYGKVSGKSIEHATGLVYSQEPAAQIVAQVAQPKPGMKVLTWPRLLGKDHPTLVLFGQSGTLVSNEIQGPLENSWRMKRFGARKCMVTNESADRLAKSFPEAFFDLIVLDALAQVRDVP